MAQWEGKSRGNPLGYRFFVVVMKYVGLYPAYFFLYFVVLYFFFFSPKTTPHALSFFRKRMGYAFLKSYVKLYRTYYLIGQLLIDKVAVMSGFGSKFKAESFGAENLQNLVAQKRGAILLGAHLGNWEIAGHYIMRYDNKINILIYDAEHQQIKDYMNSVTGEKKFNLIPIKDDLSHVYAIGEALARNEIICMHADRFVKGNRTLPVNFLGEDAHFPTGPFQVIKAFKAPYSFVYGVKTGTTSYNFFARTPREVTATSTIENMLEDYVRDLEGMVKKYPEQWFNYYDFWAKPTA